MPTFTALRAALRKATPARAWSVGERTFEAGRVALRSADPDDDEYVFSVTIGPTASEVTLWPEDPDWAVEPEPPTRGSAHAVAALLALEAGLEDLDEAEAPAEVIVSLTTRGDRLCIAGWLEQDGQRTPAPVPLPASVPGGGKQLDHLLRTARSWAGGQVPPRAYRPLLNGLLECDRVELDGAPIQVSRQPVDVVALVDRLGPHVRLRLADPPEVERAFPGEPDLVVAEGRIQPRGYGRLTQLEQHRLATPVLYAPHEVGILTSRRLPELESMVRVIRADDVPQTTKAGLQLRLDLRPSPGGALEVAPRIVYGEPPVAELLGHELVPLAGMHALPARDPRDEERLRAQLKRELGMRPGERRVVRGPEAARFLEQRLPGFTGEVHEQVNLDLFRIRGDLTPAVAMRGERLDVQFTVGDALIGLPRVMDAWERGESLVPLPDGGFAPLPAAWLAQHGAAAIHLVEGGATSGPLPSHLAPVAADLLTASDAPVPPDLRALVRVLRRDGMPELTPPDGLRATLRDYQRTGWSWLRLMERQGLGCVLADDMGLGKTLQTLACVLDGKDDGPTLVVAPRSVLQNWQDEAARFAPDLRVGALHGARRGKVLDALRDGELDLVVTTYGTLRQDADDLRRVALRLVVLDEAQAIKNPDSQTARAARSLKAEHRVALTGTPIENHLSELWSLFSFLMPGFFGSREHFDVTLGGPAASGDPRAIESLRTRVAPFVLRRLKSEVAKELPPRTDLVLRCPMSPAQKQAYDAAKRGRSALTTTKSGQPNRLAVLEILTRMRQAACHAGLVPGGSPDAASGKLDLLMEHLDELVDEGHAALVFSQWTSLLDLVEPRLEAAGIRFVRLDGSTRDRAGVVERFQDPQGPPVFLISLKAGGTGLNLTRADHVVHLDPWWNPAAEQQATDRAHRIGQERPVFAWKLVSEGTVEERVLALQERKKALADAVLAGQGVASLGADELLALLDDE